MNRSQALLPVVLLLASTGKAAEPINFTKDQVTAGQAVYRESCQLCHGNTLANGQFATPLKGEPFQEKWKGKTLGELLEFVYEKMPPDKLKSLTPEQYTSAVAFILSRNGLPASETALTTDKPAQALPW